MGNVGYRLWKLKRLDLTVECLVADTRWYGDRWLGLFTEEEVAIARQRIDELNKRGRGKLWAT